MEWIGLGCPPGTKDGTLWRWNGDFFTVAPPELTIEIAIDTIATAQLTSAQLFAQASSWLYFQRRVHSHTNEINVYKQVELHNPDF